ncbi:MAG: sensor histidine kinase [Ruminiclostridium sp.]|nr:sensor histidine kinase [Ruminiclostridium sp.]
MLRNNFIINPFAGNIKNKFLITFLVLSLLPLISVASFTYYYSSVTVEKEFIAISNRNLLQISENIDYSLRQLDIISLLSLNDREIQELLDRSNKDGYFLTIGDRERMEQFLTNLNILREDISGIYILSGRNVYYHYLYGVGIMTGYDYAGQEWYKKILKGDGERVLFGTHKPFIEKNSDSLVFSLARVIKDVNNGRNLGVIVIDANFRLISDLCGKTLDKNGWAEITDNEGKLIYSPNKSQISTKINLKDSVLNEILGKKGGDTTLNINNDKIFINYITSDYSGWKVLQFIPKREMNRTITAIGKFIFVAGAICLIISILLSFLLSGNFSKPLVDLNTVMRKIGKGDFSQHFNIKRDDEIGQLMTAVNDMAVSLLKLMAETSEAQVRQNNAELKQKDAELKQKDAELKALQNQINPHFLYNTLETVQMKAVINKQSHIAEMVAALGKLFEYSIGKGSYYVKFEEEMKYIDLYIKLQKMRYGNKIEYIIRADEEFKKSFTLKFILQPIIENSIQHGLENKSGKGVIDLYGIVFEDMVLIRISDNGIGIDKDELENIRSALCNTGDYDQKNMNIGIKNVNDRIKLFFGEQYGLDIDSCNGIGTCVTIKLPYIKKLNI